MRPPCVRLIHARLLLNLGEDLRVADEEVLLWLARCTESQRTSSPTLIWLPPHDGRRILSPGCTLTGTTLPSLSGAPGPAAITDASGSGDEALDEGRKRPEAVLVSGLKRWTNTRSRSGTTDLIERMVEVAYRLALPTPPTIAEKHAGACATRRFLTLDRRCCVFFGRDELGSTRFCSVPRRRRGASLLAVAGPLVGYSGNSSNAFGEVRVVRCIKSSGYPHSLASRLPCRLFCALLPRRVRRVLSARARSRRRLLC